MILIKLQHLIRKITASIYPNRCIFCLKVIDEDKYCCESCEKDMPQYSLKQGVKGGYRCVSALPYTGLYKRSLIRFKFRNKVRSANKFAQIIAPHIRHYYEDMIFDYITCVPMHEKAFRKRGYNQSELLAKELSKLLDIPYVETLKKIKKTDPQHKLKRDKRLTNLKGAFEVCNKKLVKNRTILIIDDTITTGCTLGECCKTLQKAGPSQLCCATYLVSGNLH